MHITKESKFNEVKKAYSNVDLENAKSLTQYVDSLLFKSRKLDEIMSLINEAKESKFTESRDFKTIAILKKHIRYRQAHDKFKVSATKSNKVRLAALDLND